MLLYEVNLEISSSIYAEFMIWLKSHIKGILTLNGFLKADLLRDKDEEREDMQKMTVAYYISDYTHYHQYLNDHADRMRNDGIQRFEGLFTASRRLLEIEETYKIDSLFEAQEKNFY